MTLCRERAPEGARAGKTGRGRRGAARAAALALCGAAALSAPPAALAGDEAGPVAIASRASPAYTRTRLADGTPQPETFSFAKGGLMSGTEAGTKDLSDFMMVATTLAGPLASQGYVASQDPSTTKLLVMVYWGTTRTPDHPTNSTANELLQDAYAAALDANHPDEVHFNKSDSCAPMQMATTSTASYAVRNPDQLAVDGALTSALALAAAEDHARSQLDTSNANLLGYDASLAEPTTYAGTPFESRQRDLLDEIEARRYFVVLLAYDFQEMWRHKRARLLWETRYSIREQGNDFAKELAAMTAAASPYFGRNSGPLVHRPMPEGHVEIGPIRTLAAYGAQK